TVQNRSGSIHRIERRGLVRKRGKVITIARACGVESIDNLSLDGLNACFFLGTSLLPGRTYKEIIGILSDRIQDVRRNLAVSIDTRTNSRLDIVQCLGNGR